MSLISCMTVENEFMSMEKLSLTTYFTSHFLACSWSSNAVVLNQ
jgi:hypothetical protein